MEDNKTNGHKDVLLDRRQLDQVMKAINKQISHAQYEYKDSGALQVEMDELFSYEEINTLLPRLVANRQASLLQMKAIELDIWIEQLLDQLESGYEQRIQAAQGLLYIALGDFDQWINDRKKHLDTIIKNNALLFDRGVFHSVHQVLKRACNQLSSSNNKPIDNNKNLLFEIDLYLTINYLIIESNRQQGRFENDQDLLEMDILKYLFLMLARLKDGFMQSFPMKKLLLLISKVLLATLGNIQNTKDMKNEARRRHGLPIKRKTPIIKCSHRDLYTFQNDLASRYPTYTPSNIESTIFSNISPLTIKASSALATAMGISNATKQTTLPYQVLFPPKQPKSNNDNNKQANNPGVQGNTGLASDDPWHSSQTVVLPLLETGPSLPVGLKEANATYQQHLEISLADYQILMERQRAIQKWQELEKERTTYSNDQIRLSSSERTTTTTPMDEGQDSIKDKFDIIEQFYASIAPELQGIVIVLLKQLLTTATAKSKPTSKNNGQQLYQDGKQIKETTSMDRHREVLCKSISAILLLLLKWFKISHVLKFEYLSQLLVDSGCMLLILKIFGLQEIGTLASIKTDADEYGLFRQMESLQPQSNGIAATSNGSSYVSPPLSPSSESHYTNERNLFWIINLLHVLQMLSRDKVHRIMLLVQYKSSAIFKRVLKISHPVVELYALKNLKNQIPYLGRKWRSSNMKIISSIYFRCPPDFRDDWLITRNDKEEIS
ncbi:uncharacterized protein BX664DRAFT_33163 [Halteromyces radiatus]|uniref:uncharacterized protein n=1 Tax=Halteromyces radiatus TaxID=101107 RepID=UPI00221F2DC1|nr:uncharacterized protein BX664DRAFT_33163 [Halteromyces radiatus]KAI8100081.1 hypothetical protein BX664DRAFT_33163 [Halteromyces radiatus]